MYVYVVRLQGNLINNNERRNWLLLLLPKAWMESKQRLAELTASILISIYCQTFASFPRKSKITIYVRLAMLRNKLEHASIHSQVWPKESYFKKWTNLHVKFQF